MKLQIEFKVTAPPFRWDEAGGIRIGKSSVTLDSLLASYKRGSTPEEIAVQYSVLSLEEIYTAIAYYLSHPKEMEKYLQQRYQKAQEQRNQFVKQYNLANLRQRLNDRNKSIGELITNASING